MTRKLLLFALGVAVVAHLFIFLPLPIVVQSLAVLVLTALLPGFLLVDALLSRSAAPPGPWERTLYSLAAGYGLMISTMLLVSYLPGPATRWQTLIAFDLLLVVLFAWCWLVSRSPVPRVTPEWAGLDRRWLLAGVLVLAGVGLTLRLVNLGYADFQGDEARAALRAAAVIQGYDDVLMLHKKGPTEILAPTALYVLTGQLTETTARLPFALANIAALFAIWLLGWRIFGPLAGWIAAIFLALDGYFIGFARIVQYQSIVLLMSLLVVLILVRLLREPRAFAAYLSLAALLLATGVLSHYEGVLVALPAAFLWLVLLWREREQRRSLLMGTLVALGVAAVALGLFYLPYVLNPRFAATYQYLTDRRIGNSFPYNNLVDIFLRTTLYSTTYAVLLLIGLTLIGMVRVWLRGWQDGWQRIMALAASLIAVLVFAVTFANPQWLLIGETDWAFAPIALLLGLVIITPRQKAEERALWLWFSAVMLLAIFFTEKPRTHVYTFFMPWLLICGDVAAAGWNWLSGRIGVRRAAWLGAGGAAALILLFANYAGWYFLSRDEVMLDYATKHPAGYWVTYDTPDDKARFGFPLNNGWKTIGELYRQNVLSGPFDSNEKEAWVPAWYSHGVDRCPRDAEWFFEIRNLEPFTHEDRLEMEHFLRDGFEKWAKVQVDGRDKMIIYKRTGEKLENPAREPNDDLPVYRAEDFTAAFDANALATLPLTYPSIDPPIANPLHENFGDKIWLEGYEIDAPKPLRPGDVIRLTLFWRAQQPIDKSYKVFNQVYFGDGPMIAQRDGYPVCDGRETWRWDPGELITDPYLIPVKADAPDGLYPLYTGLYLEETGERLPLLDADGVEIGSQVHIADVRIGEE